MTNQVSEAAAIHDRIRLAHAAVIKNFDVIIVDRVYDRHVDELIKAVSDPRIDIPQGYCLSDLQADMDATDPDDFPPTRAAAAYALRTARSLNIPLNDEMGKPLYELSGLVRYAGCGLAEW